MGDLLEEVLVLDLADLPLPRGHSDWGCWPRQDGSMQRWANLQALYWQRFPLGSLNSLHNWTADGSRMSSFLPMDMRLQEGLSTSGASGAIC